MLHGKKSEEKQVIIDTTLQEKNITYPTDGKLAIRMINHLHKIAKKENIQFRRTFVREVKEHRIKLRFFRHPKKYKKAKVSMKRLRTIVGILIRDSSRKLGEERANNYQEKFELFEKVRKQQMKEELPLEGIRIRPIHSMKSIRSMSMEPKPLLYPQ